MKKTLIVLLALTSIECLHAAEPMSKDELNAKLQYLLTATDAKKHASDFTITYTINKLEGTGLWMDLASDYKVKSQEGKYIGLQKGNTEPGTSPNVSVSTSKDGTITTNTITANNEEAYAHGWVSRDAQGASTPTSNNFAGTTVTITSKSGEQPASSFTLQTGTVINAVQNTASLSVDQVMFTGTGIKADSLTLNGTAFDDISPLSGVRLTETITAAGRTWGGDIAFNFAISSSSNVTDGSVIAAYTVGQGTSDYTANAFVLTLSGEDVLLSAGDGKLSADKSTFTAQGNRFQTLTGVSLQRDTEYTVIVRGRDQSQVVMLFEGTNYLGTMNSYNGNMNGGIEAGGTLYTYTNQQYAFTPVPEPATGTLSLLALAGLCARRRRK